MWCAEGVKAWQAPRNPGLPLGLLDGLSEYWLNVTSWIENIKREVSLGEEKFGSVILNMLTVKPHGALRGHVGNYSCDTEAQT